MNEQEFQDFISKLTASECSVILQDQKSKSRYSEDQLEKIKNHKIALDQLAALTDHGGMYLD